MKKIILSLIVFMGIENLGFARVLYKEGTRMQVVNVKSDDSLNLRVKPTYKSSVVAQIPYNFENLVFLENQDCTKWVNVGYGNKNTQFNGWINQKFIAPLHRVDRIFYKNFEISYPIYINANEEENAISFKYCIPYKFSQWANGRDGEKSFDSFCNFSMKILFYNDMKSALKANYIENYDFKNESFKFPIGVEKIKKSEVIVLGTEGCWEIITIKKIKDKIIVALLSHNINTITAKKEPKCEIFDLTKKLKIQNEIINSMK